MPIRGVGSTNESVSRLIGLLVFFLTFTFYLFTIAPDVTFWDSGELILGAFSLGLPHPPAYPVFCTIGKLFSFLPLGNVAYRINVMSAVFGAATAWLLFRLVREVCNGAPNSEWLAASAAVFFATIKPFWGVSVVAEVYTINSLLLTATVLLLLRHSRGGGDRYILAASFMFGLAFVNHQSTVFLLPGFIFYCITADGNYKKPQILALMVFFFALAFSVNLYLPLRATTSPLLNVGVPLDWTRFSWVIKWPEHFRSLPGFLHDLPARLGGNILVLIVGAACAGVSGYLLWKRKFLLFLMYSGGLYFLMIKAMAASSDVAEKFGLASKFYVPAALFLVVFVADALFSGMGSSAGKKGATSYGAAVIVVSVGLVIGAGYQSVKNYYDVNNSRNFFAYDFAMNTLKSVKPNAALFSVGDNIVFPIWYMQGVENYRPDVFFVHTDLITYKWYLDQKALEMYSKYKVGFIPPTAITDIKTNLPILRIVLEKRTPTYFDYSTLKTLDYPFERFKSQGLVHLTSSWEAEPEERLWNRYVFRGAYDGTSNKAFAAEGVLDIFAWECGLWAQDAFNARRLEESLRAYNLAVDLGMKNPIFDEWAKGLSKELKENSHN